MQYQERMLQIDQIFHIFFFPIPFLSCSSVRSWLGLWSVDFSLDNILLCHIISDAETRSYWPVSSIFYSIRRQFQEVLIVPTSRSTILILSLIFGFPGFSWSLDSAVNSSSLIIVLQFISDLITRVFAFFHFI